MGVMRERRDERRGDERGGMMREGGYERGS